MINIDEFKTIIAERERLWKETHDEWDCGIDKCRGKLVSLLTSDIFATNEFLKTQCSFDEILWISEVFDTIAEKTQSKEFITTLREVVQKFPDGEQKDRLIYEINWAESQAGLDEK